MPDMKSKPPYSYRQDPAVPTFPDDRPLFIFDGVCVLCSGRAAWLMRHDKRDLFRFAPAQSPLGQALYKHYGFAMDETYLLIDRGAAYSKSRGYLHILDTLGGWWIALKVFNLIPNAMRDFIYDIVARNRYKWFGKVEFCRLLPESHKRKLL
jgi:predicted DCC family thiol-disulfide oxidoreductase YuxK